MMGYTHTLSAAAVWVTAHELGFLAPMDHGTLLVTTLACAGAGMFPDIDHKNGTIAHSMPPVSTVVSATVSAVSGGHRKGTHSILGVVFFWALAVAAQQLTHQGIPYASLFLAGYAGGLTLRMLGAPGGWIGAIGLGYLAWVTGSLAILPLSIAVGATVHIVGDLMTTRGVNLVWPLVVKPVVASALWRKSGYMALPILGDAGSRREHALGIGLALYLIWSALALTGQAPTPWAYLSHINPLTR